MSNSLTPEKMIRRILEKVETDYDTTKGLIQELFTIITEQLKESDRMALHGFGTFKKIHVDETEGRNPQTGEPLTIPAHYRIKFSPAAALADRINAEYRDLKPVLLDNAPEPAQDVHEGLLVKAMRYEHSFHKDDQQEAASLTQHIEIHGTSLVAPAEHNSGSPLTVVNRDEDETRALAKAVSENSEKSEKKGYFYTAAALLAIALLLGGIYWGTRRAEPKEIPPSEITPMAGMKETDEAVPAGQQEISNHREPDPPPGEAAVQQEPQISEAIAAEKAAAPSETAITQESRTYSITSGDSFSIIARDVWGNIHLWPYLYEANKDSYPDPDYIRPGDTIIIPPRPDEVTQIDQIESSILQAYQKYRSLMDEQNSSWRNIRRAASSRNVLASGEILSPSFLDRNKSSIRPEDIQRVEEILER